MLSASSLHRARHLRFGCCHVSRSSARAVSAGTRRQVHHFDYRHDCAASRISPYHANRVK